MEFLELSRKYTQIMSALTYIMLMLTLKLFNRVMINGKCWWQIFKNNAFLYMHEDALVFVFRYMSRRFRQLIFESAMSGDNPYSFHNTAALHPMMESIYSKA